MTAIDVTRSRAEFAVKHLMITTVRGSIPILRGEVGESLVEAFLDPSRITTGDDARDAYMRGEEGFQTSRYPRIEFRSTSFVSKRELRGKLKIKDREKDIVLAVVGDGTSAKATCTLDRRDFGITFGALEPAVGREVKVTLHIFLVC